MFGQKLKELRLNKNLTQKKLSELIDCNQSMITRWEKGECEPTASAIIKIAILFEISTDELLEIKRQQHNNRIAIIIKNERKQRNMTQEELAKIIGVTQDSISLWEKGKRIPDTIYIISLCKFFDIPADYLLGIKDIDGNEIEQYKNLITDNRKYNIKTYQHKGDINIK